MYVISNENNEVAALTKDPIILNTTCGDTQRKVAVHRYNPEVRSEDLLKIASEITSTSSLSYMILTSSASLCQDLLKMKSKVLYQPPHKDPTPYLDAAIKLSTEPYVPPIGCFMNPAEHSAGVLPFVYHNNELFCMLGIDKKTGQYSDYGGGFDKRFERNSRDKYKNSILSPYRTSNGTMNKKVLVDHFVTHYSPKAVFTSELKTNNLGFGDTNTKYTAFREFSEETSYVHAKKRSPESDYRLDFRLRHLEYKAKTMFSLDAIFNKLYDKNLYVYLGGDSEYAYDMFLVFMTAEELPGKVRVNFLNLYNSYKKNESLYTQSRLIGPTEQNCIRMDGTLKMYENA